MGWMRTALRQLNKCQAATVEYTGGSLRGRIESGQTITISQAVPSDIAVEDVVLVRWKSNPVLRVVTDVQQGQFGIGDTLSPVCLGWVGHADLLGKVTAVHPLPNSVTPKQKPHVTTFGLDTPTDYGHARVLNALAVEPLDRAEPGDKVAAQVLFMPSFDAECCVTVSSHGGTAKITLVTMQTNLWYWWCHQMQTARGNIAPGLPPHPPVRWRESAIVPPESFAPLHASLSAMGPMTAPEQKYVTLDGMKVRAQWRNALGETASFESSIGKDQPHYAMAAAIYELARDLLREEPSVICLEHLHGYLDLGLPIKFIDGPPLTVRIFGSLSSSAEAALFHEFSCFPANVPLLVDMSNFGGMGTLLYPLFQRFSVDRRDATVWWVNVHAKQQLEEAGIPPSATFVSREEAVRALQAR